MVDTPHRASYGARLIAALVPSRYGTLRDLERACGISYQTLHAWKKGGEPRMSEAFPGDEPGLR